MYCISGSGGLVTCVEWRDAMKRAVRGRGVGGEGVGGWVGG